MGGAERMNGMDNDEQELLRQLADALEAAGRKACASGRYGYCINDCCTSATAVHDRALIERARTVVGMGFGPEPRSNQINAVHPSRAARG